MKLQAVAFMIVILFAAPLWALSLDEAKTRGLLGETPSGYLGAVGANTPREALDVMRDINGKRRNEYEAIAKKNGTNVSDVEALAGKRAIDQTPSGQFVKLERGWIRK